MKKRIAIIALCFLSLLGIVALTVFANTSDADPQLNIWAYNLSFEDSVYIKYGVYGNDYDDVKLLIWREPQTSYLLGTESAILQPTGTETIEDRECLVFKYTGVYAKNMADNVYARAYVEKSGTVYYSDVKKYSILQYVYNKTGRTGIATEDGNLITLLNDMLEYGSSAQIYFNYRTDRLANADWYQISVVGGTLDDLTLKGLYLPGDSVNLTAPAENALGEAFSYWKDDREMVVGTSTAVSITAANSNRTYTAVYGSAVPDTIVPDGTLLYYEDFEKYEDGLWNYSLFDELGWVPDSIENGAYQNNNSYYSIRWAPEVFWSDTNTKSLLLENYDASKDSYIIVVPASLMGKFHESNYSYQYDLTYYDLDASKPDRYLCIVSDYNGRIYNSFHLRNRGTANNQTHYDGRWINYDSEGEYWSQSTAPSIGEQLLGITYDAEKQVLRDKQVSLSIRYVVDWENGNSVFIRVNTAGYPGYGKWTLVSRYSVNSAAANFTINDEPVDLLDPNNFGGAIALKAGGKQNGYIDNIIVWTGTGDEPADKSSPFFKSDDTGCTGHLFVGAGTCADPKICAYCGKVSDENTTHTFTDINIEGNTDRVCSCCGILESNLENGWKIKEIPSFEGGYVSANEDVYLSGQTPVNGSLDRSRESKMLIASGANSSDLADYCLKLERYGYLSDYTGERDGNIYRGYTDGTNHVYAYYTAYSEEVRIIYDRTGSALTGFGYERDATTTDPAARTVVYQYGLRMSDDGTGTTERLNNGMMYVIRLADNKLVIIDGGAYRQFDQNQVDGLMTFMRQITGKETGKIDVAAWYITHGHYDHLSGFCKFLQTYNDQITLERMIFNFPSTFYSGVIIGDFLNNYGKLMTYVYDNNPEAAFLKIHTGQKVTLCDFTINCLSTHEDLVSAGSGQTLIGTDFNCTGTVSRMDFDGLRFMVLGDVNRKVANILIDSYSESTLESDILQLAHHMINDLCNLYHIIKAPAVFAPQSSGGAESRFSYVRDVALSYVSDPVNLFKYAASGTYGYAAGADGRPALVYSRDGVDGGFFDGTWDW